MALFRTLSLITVVSAVYFFHEGFGIKCWVCRSDSDPKCGDPFDNSSVPIIDCKQEKDLEHIPGVRPTMCRKIRQKVNGEWRYFRSCAYLGEPGIQGDERFCLMRTGTYNIWMEYCTCNTKDGCNTGSLTALSSLAAFVFVLVTLFRIGIKYNEAKFKYQRFFDTAGIGGIENWNRPIPSN